MPRNDAELQDSLLQARQGTAFFARKLGELPDDSFGEPSLLPGWTRRHVVAHVGFNALAIARLVNWARTGREDPMYPSPAAREQEIDLGALLSPTELRELFRDASARLDTGWRQLPGAAWQHTVRTAQGRLVPASETVWMRTRETWIHAVDLANGADFEDIPPAVLTRVLQDVTGTWAAHGTGADPRLLATDTAQAIPQPAGPQDASPVTGTLADLTRWATGRGTGGRPPAPRWLLRGPETHARFTSRQESLMPAITAENPLALPRLPGTRTAPQSIRPVTRVVTAHRQPEGAGFTVSRPFPGALSADNADPFILLDQVGPQVNAPGEATGAPRHPHRGFETVSYVMDSEIAHHDSNGGGGVIGKGDTRNRAGPARRAHRR